VFVFNVPNQKRTGFPFIWRGDFKQLVIPERLRFFAVKAMLDFLEVELYLHISLTIVIVRILIFFPDYA
jgi:hypothetical protein